MCNQVTTCCALLHVAVWSLISETQSASFLALYPLMATIVTIWGVTIHWTGPLDWTTGLDYWTRRNRSQTRSQTEITLVCVN